MVVTEWVLLLLLLLYWFVCVTVLLALCNDEPDFVAVFDVDLITGGGQSNFDVLGNSWLGDCHPCRPFCIPFMCAIYKWENNWIINLFFVFN